jgi:hypothetical protein
MDTAPAPEVGDFGYLGLPSRDTRERRGAMQNFGAHRE